MHEFQRQDVVDVLHGVPVSDPYRWLEDRDSPLTQEWLDVQREQSDAYFSACEGVEWLRERVRVLLDREEVSQPIGVGSRIFFRRRNVGQEQPCICMSYLDKTGTQVLIDPSERGPMSSVLIHRVSDNGSLLAFACANGGSDAKEMHFLDVDCATVLPDFLPMARSRGIEFFRDNTGFYYSLDGAGASSSNVHAIRRHVFGLTTGHDPVIFSVPRSSLSKLILLGDEVNLGALHVYETSGGFKSDVYRTLRDEPSAWKLVTGGLPATTGVVFRDGKIFFFRETWDRQRELLCIELGRETEHLLIPAGEDRILEVSIRKDYIYSHHSDGAESTFHVWALDGTYIGIVDVPDGGTIRMCSPLGTASNTLFYTYESFDSPQSVLQFDPETFMSQPWLAGSTPVRKGWCTSSNAFYSAKDGTSVPVTLVTDSRKPEFENRFALMTSYGGFGVSMTPQFSVLATVMLELGAIFVVPHIRGGGEGGPSWHQAAVGANRQVAFDDFIGAAEWLCKQGFTSEKKIAIFGGSNSAILVAVAGTQRPDLFGAFMCIAGLFDMVRYECFDRAGKWRPELGSVSDEVAFHALYSYSPYHHVDELVDYPAFLFVAGDQDDRCNSAHSRKIVARLQQRIAQQNPILLDYTAYRGHSPVMPLNIRIEALAFRLAFLCRELGIEVPRRVTHVASAF